MESGRLLNLFDKYNTAVLTGSTLLGLRALLLGCGSLTQALARKKIHHLNLLRFVFFRSHF